MKSYTLRIENLKSKINRIRRWKKKIYKKEIEALKSALEFKKMKRKEPFLTTHNYSKVSLF